MNQPSKIQKVLFHVFLTVSFLLSVSICLGEIMGLLMWALDSPSSSISSIDWLWPLAPIWCTVLISTISIVLYEKKRISFALSVAILPTVLILLNWIAF